MNDLIEETWQRLSRVDSLTFVSSSTAGRTTGWTGKATGQVEVRRPSIDCLTYHESGTWQTPQGRTFDFSNTYRWQCAEDRIRLEHLRFGEARPVYLFDLTPASGRHLASERPHVCSDELYTASLELSDEGIELIWTVVGPQLNERIEYHYRQAEHPVP